MQIHYSFIDNDIVMNNMSNYTNHSKKSKKYLPVKNKFYINTGQLIDLGIIDKRNSLNINNEIILSTSELIVKNLILIKSNIDDSNDTYTFILPKYPDIDVIISVYILIDFLKYSRLSDFDLKLAKYASLIENKIIEMNRHSIYTLYPVYEALAYSIDNSSLNYNEKPQKKIKDGLELIDCIQYAFNLYQDFHIDIDNNIFLQYNSKFKEYIEFLTTDYKNYCNEIKGAKKIYIDLPCINANETKSISSIFFDKNPKSKFFRHWAYSALNKNEGFDLIIIHTKNTKNTKFNSSIMLRKRLGVSLIRLDEYLNTEEKNLIKTSNFKNLSSKNHSKNNIWTIRKPEHNIVFSPEVGTFFDLDYLKKILSNYTAVQLKKSILYYFIPISFNAHSSYINFNPSFDSNKYFYTHISSLIKENPINIKSLEYISNYKINNLSYYIFNKKIGFISLCIEYKNSSSIYPYSCNNIKDINNYINKNFSAIFNKLRKTIENDKNFKEYKIGKINDLTFGLDNNFYTFQLHEIEDNKLSENKKQKFINDVCNLSNNNDNEQTNFIYNGLNKDILELNNSFCSFNEFGGIIAFINNNITTQNINYIFLFVLQQRITMIKIINELALCSSKKNQVKKISDIRNLFVEFIANGKFNQITHDTYGSKIYDFCCSQYEIETLYSETKDQLDSIFDYHQTLFSNKVEKLSSLFFPAITIVSFLDLFIETKHRVHVESSLVLTIIVFLIFLGKLFNKFN